MARRSHHLVLALSIAIGLLAAIATGQATQPDTDKGGEGVVTKQLFGAPAAIADGEKRADAILARLETDPVIGRAGYYMDKLEQSLQLIEGALVERISDTVILLRFDAEFVFRKKWAMTYGQGRLSIYGVGRLLTNFKKTAIVVQVFTDSAGKEKKSQRLSARRAKTVKLHLEASGVNETRVAAVGYGGGYYPIASNETESGRKRNRRVDILLKAKDR